MLIAFGEEVNRCVFIAEVVLYGLLRHKIIVQNEGFMLCKSAAHILYVSVSVIYGTPARIVCRCMKKIPGASVKDVVLYYKCTLIILVSVRPALDVCTYVSIGALISPTVAASSENVVLHHEISAVTKGVFIVCGSREVLYVVYTVLYKVVRISCIIH